MKLSKVQREWLTEIVREGQGRAVRSYPPIRKLLALGLIEAMKEHNSYDNRWIPTEEGRKVVAES